MARRGHNWQSTRWGERGDEYSWQDENAYDHYGWLKRVGVAGLIFAIVYCAHSSDTRVGRVIDEGVQNALSTPTDFTYIIEQVSNQVPTVLDLAVLKRVQSAVSKPADPLLYMSKPVDGKMVAPFGWQVHPVSKQGMMHEGIDVEAALGANIKAAAPGKVKAVTESLSYGKTLIVEHSQDIDTVYGHMGEILVNQGDLVSQGQVVGKAGKIGTASSSLLYFELREKGKAIDPLSRMKGEFLNGEGK